MSSPPPPTAKQKLKERRQAMYRQVVLEAAEQVFADVGFDAAKVQEIANKSGLALGTLYGVFPGKSDIHRAIHESRALGIIAHCIRAVRPGDNPLEQLLHGIGGYVQYQVDNPTYLLMTLREGYAWTTPESMLLPEQEVAWQQGFSMAEQVVALGLTQGVFVDEPPSFLARTMIALSQTCLADWVDRGMSEPVEVVVRRTQRAIVGVVATPAARDAWLSQESA